MAIERRAEAGELAGHPCGDGDDDNNRRCGDKAEKDRIFDHGSAVFFVAELPGHRHELLHANYSLWRFTRRDELRMTSILKHPRPSSDKVTGPSLSTRAGRRIRPLPAGWC